MDVLFILGGFVCLLIGGDLLVRGAVGVAVRAGLSPMVIGLTLVGFGTSMPELVTSIQAAASGSSGIAIGNVVGSNIANILLILGVAALIKPIACSPHGFARDTGALVLASLACLGAVILGDIGRTIGVVFLIALAVYLVIAIRTGAPVEAIPDGPPPPGVPLSLLYFLAGLAIIILGAAILVKGAVGLATGLGVSETIIGLTIVAVGTSLPELITSAMAALRGQSDIALGNVIGSNLFNILGILGATALAQPLQVPAQIAGLDIWVMLAATALLVVLARTGWKLTRLEAAALLISYCAYVAWLIVSAGPI